VGNSQRVRLKLTRTRKAKRPTTSGYCNLEFYPLSGRSLKSILDRKVMGKYILVPLSPRDQGAEIMPRIEEIAKTGMTVIFLTRYRRNGLFEKRRLKPEFSAEGLATDPDALMRRGYEQQMRLADRKISVAREALRGRGVKVIAYVYMGRLRPLLIRYKRNDTV